MSNVIPAAPAAPAFADGDKVAASAVSTASAAPGLFAKPLTEMHLQLKTDSTEGIQGTYVIAGQSNKILLAGESENADVIMEESINGKDVPAEWAGQLICNTFSGSWSTTDDAVTKPFVLTVQAAKHAK